jgi:hypothetical protein
LTTGADGLRHHKTGPCVIPKGALRLFEVSRGFLVLVAQVLLVVLAFVGEIYGGSLWFAVPPLLLAYALYAGRLGRRT